MVQTRATLKAWFENGDIPTQAQFADLIDSMLNFLDDDYAKKEIFRFEAQLETSHILNIGVTPFEIDLPILTVGEMWLPYACSFRSVAGNPYNDGTNLKIFAKGKSKENFLFSDGGMLAAPFGSGVNLIKGIPNLEPIGDNLGNGEKLLVTNVNSISGNIENPTGGDKKVVIHGFAFKIPTI